MRAFTVMIVFFLSANAFAGGFKYISAQQLVLQITQGQRYGADSMQSVERHFRDSNKKYISMSDMAKIKTLPPAHIVTGSNFIMSALFPWTYKYDVFPDGNTLVIRTKIHFKNIKPAQLASLREKMKDAENIWNENIPDGMVGFQFRFQFDIVSRAQDAYYSVGYLPKTRGPFYKNWSEEWQGKGIAHEIGHVMGLSDEYDEMAASGGCNGLSIMCDGWYGMPVTYHYYHILRRALIPVK